MRTHIVRAIALGLLALVVSEGGATALSATPTVVRAHAGSATVGDMQYSSVYRVRLISFIDPATTTSELRPIDPRFRLKPAFHVVPARGDHFVSVLLYIRNVTNAKVDDNADLRSYLVSSTGKIYRSFLPDYVIGTLNTAESAGYGFFQLFPNGWLEGHVVFEVPNGTTFGRFRFVISHEKSLSWTLPRR